MHPWLLSFGVLYIIQYMHVKYDHGEIRNNVRCKFLRNRNRSFLLLYLLFLLHLLFCCRFGFHLILEVPKDYLLKLLQLSQISTCEDCGVTLMRCVFFCNLNIPCGYKICTMPTTFLFICEYDAIKYFRMPFSLEVIPSAQSSHFCGV